MSRHLAGTVFISAANFRLLERFSLLPSVTTRRSQIVDNARRLFRARLSSIRDSSYLYFLTLLLLVTNPGFSTQLPNATNWSPGKN